MSTDPGTAPSGTARPGTGTGRERDVPAVLDLDSHPPAPPPARRPLWSAVVLAVLVGVLAGAWGRSTSATAAPTLRPHVSARATLWGFTPATSPQAIVQVVLTSHDAVEYRIRGLTLDGAGLARTGTHADPLPAPGDPRLGPGLTVRLHVPVDLHCPGNAADGPLRVSVALDGGDISGAVAAAPAGVAAFPAGACTALRSSLPEGWSQQAMATAQWSGDRVVLHVTGLPADASRLVGVRADGWLVPMDGGPVPVRNRSATAVLLEVTPLCTDTGTRGVLPVGLQLLLSRTTGGLEQAYVPLGPRLAGWLLDGRDRACPATSGPAAPPRGRAAPTM